VRRGLRWPRTAHISLHTSAPVCIIGRAYGSNRLCSRTSSCRSGTNYAPDCTIGAQIRRTASSGCVRLSPRERACSLGYGAGGSRSCALEPGGISRCAGARPCRTRLATHGSPPAPAERPPSSSRVYRLRLWTRLHAASTRPRSVRVARALMPRCPSPVRTGSRSRPLPLRSGQSARAPGCRAGCSPSS